MNLGPGFYAIVDPEHTPHGALETAEAILRGGCAVLQLRDKRGDDRASFELALGLAELCREASVPFVVNDRLDIALLADADGLHLGQEDISPERVREHFTGFIGLSTHSLAQAKDASENHRADLIGFGPVFETTSKLNPDPVQGETILRQVCSEVALSVVAIGGIERQHLDIIAGSGARFGAAISAVTKCDSLKAVEQAARTFHEKLSRDTTEISGVQRRGVPKRRATHDR